MATRFELVIAPHDGADIARLRAAGEEAIAEIEHWHRRLNYFAKDSDVALINREAAVQPLRIEGELYALLEACGRLHRETGGAFDITVAPLMRAHGFREGCAGHDEHSDERGFDAVELDRAAQTIRFRSPGCAIDLGGIGKGWALDRAAEMLRAHGVTSALMHGGTSAAIAIGAPPGQRAWKVAIQPPPTTRGWAAESSRFVAALRDAAIAVSAPHGRRIEKEDEWHGHIMDPRSGRPAAGAALAAAICDSAADADAWSTATVVLAGHPADAPERLSSLIAVEGDEGLVWSARGPQEHLFSQPVARAQPS